MGDIVQILIFVGVIIAVFVDGYYKTKKKAEQEKMAKSPKGAKPEEVKKTPKPFLTYDYDPATPLHQPEKLQLSKEKAKTERLAPPPPPIPEEPETDLEFNIQSQEEVRKAVIWSEILNRKY